MNPKRIAGGMFIFIALLPLAYIGAYFTLLALPRGNFQFAPFLTGPPEDSRAGYVAINGEWENYPSYHGLPDWIFAPIHNYDRTLRPALWSGTYPRDEELSFDWLRESGSAPAKSK